MQPKIKTNTNKMGKDSYWFRHDSASGRGIRIRKIQHIYGHEGKGIYWDVIEVLREQENYTHPADDSSLQMLCDLIGYKDPIRFKNWFNDCVKFNLLILRENVFFSEVLAENMVKWDQSKLAGIQSGKARNERKLNGTTNETRTERPTKREHKRRVYKKRVEKNNTSFPDSSIFDKVKFSKSFEGWSKDKLKYYYDSALTWSNEGNMKKDWIGAIRNWANRDEKEGKLKFQADKADPKKNIDTRIGFYDPQ